MKGMIHVCVVVATAGLAAAFSYADPPVRNSDVELVLDFMTAEDGTLDAPDDVLLDADPCDPDQPEELETVPAPDGHLLTLGELMGVSGRASVKCDTQGTHVAMQLSGLIPNGVYTIWLLTFEAPGFTPDFANFIGEGSLGSPDGSKNRFVASEDGKASLSVRQPAGALSEFGEVTGCLLDEFEFHLVGAYHPDGLTYGATPGPVDVPNPFCVFIEHFGFAFQSLPEGVISSPGGPAPNGHGPICSHGRCRHFRPPPAVCSATSEWSCAGMLVGSICEDGRCGGTCKQLRGSEDCFCDFGKRSRFCD